VAWLRATRCTGTRPHRASQAPIACTASLHRTPPFQATKSKAFLVLSGRGAAVALVALRRDLGTDCARTPWSLNEPRKLPHAEGARACGNVLGCFRRPACRPQSVPRIKSARASKGVKRDRTGCPPSHTPNLDPPPFDTGRPLSSNRLCPLSSMHRLQKARHNRSGSPRSGCIRALVGRR
jgi:hypothetical protein